MTWDAGLSQPGGTRPVSWPGCGAPAQAIDPALCADGIITASKSVEHIIKKGRKEALAKKKESGTADRDAGREIQK